MLYIITIVLDGMKFLPIQLATFNRLKIPWKWIVIEGTARNTHCTGWCSEMPARVSNDGSYEWLLELRGRHPNVIHTGRGLWEGKIEMFNYAVSIIHDQQHRKNGQTAVVLECDVDELWTSDQLTKIYDIFTACPAYGSMQFKCRYFLGPNIAITSDQCYGNRGDEWMRAWRYSPDFQFLRHEPPMLKNNHGRLFSRQQTEKMGLVFDHQAYFYRSQLEWKEKFYQYPNAVEQWEALQSAPKPCRVGDYLKWVTDGAICDRVVKI